MNKTIKKTVVAFCLFQIASAQLKAQENIPLNSYLLNPLIANPTSAGSSDGISINAIHQNQYTNFDGSPKLTTVSIQTPISNSNFGIGLTIQDYKIGAHQITSYSTDLSHAFKVTQRNHYLAFALRTEVDQFKTNYSSVIFNSSSGMIYTEALNYSHTTVNLRPSICYYGNRFYIGTTVPSVNIYSDNKNNIYPSNTWTGFGGVAVKICSLIEMRPSFLMKYESFAPLSIDANLSFSINNKISFGGSYRLGSAAGSHVIYSLTKSIRLGYAYEKGLNAIQKYNIVSHQIMINYNFSFKNNNLNSRIQF